MIGVAATSPFKAQSLANDIRMAAGIPRLETYGPRVKVGLSNVSILTDKDGDLALDSIAQANAFAGTSAAGTEVDPVIIENFRFDNSETAALALQFAGSESFHCTIRNCWFSGYDIGAIRSTATNVTINLDKCLFTYDDTTGDPSDTSTNHIIMQGGDANINITACHAPEGGRNFVRTLVGYTGTITVRDSTIDDSSKAWTGPSVNQSAAFEFGGTAACTMDIQYCEISGIDNDTMSYGIWISSNQTVAVSLIAKNNLINGTGKSNLGAGISIAGPGTLAHSGTIQFNKFSNQLRDSINIITCDGFNIFNNDFDDSAVNFRHLLANGTAGYDITNLEVAHNKAAASVGANSEPFYFLETINTSCHDNWVTEASDDAYEFTRPQTGCECYNNVGDNITGQVVDIYQERGVNPGAVNVYNIFGDGNIGVDLNSRTSGDTVSAIYVDTTSGINPIIRLINENAAPANISIMSPLAKSELSGSGSVVAVSGAMGANNHINGVAIT